MLYLMPHTYQVRVVSETATGGVVYGSLSDERYGLLTPLSPSAIYREWGLELRNPFALYAQLTDVVGLKPADRIIAGGQTYTVIAIERRDVEDLATHAKILLERLDYT